MESIMIECTLDVLKNMDQYSDDTEFFAYKVSRKDGSSFLYADNDIWEWRKRSIWFSYGLDDDEKAFIPLTHAVGTKFELLKADADPKHACGPGINVGTLKFLQDFISDYKHKNYKDINGPYSLDSTNREYAITLWKVKFTKKDIACLPFQNWGDGWNTIAEKFRLFRCEAIEELPLSLLEVPKEKIVINDPVAPV